MSKVSVDVLIEAKSIVLTLDRDSPDELSQEMTREETSQVIECLQAAVNYVDALEPV